MSTRLCTVGYQGLAAADLRAALHGAAIERVIDVRAVPLSRKPGFGRRQLAAGLALDRVDYVHLPALGTPKPGRDAARRGDRGTLERVYAAHLGTETAREGLATALTLVRDRPSCLLCFEADPLCCHRRLVADALAADAPLTVVHLRPLARHPTVALRGHGAT